MLDCGTTPARSGIRIRTGNTTQNCLFYIYGRRTATQLYGTIKQGLFYFYSYRTATQLYSGIKLPILILALLARKKCHCKTATQLLILVLALLARKKCHRKTATQLYGTVKQSLFYIYGRKTATQLYGAVN